MYVCMYGNLLSIYLYEIKGTEMTLKESRAAFSALMNNGLLWPGSFVLLKDPSLTRHTEEYIEVRHILACIMYIVLP